MQNPQMIASRIKQLAKDNNISIGRLCKECGGCQLHQSNVQQDIRFS